MLDYSLIYFIIFFVFWIYMLELTIDNNDKIAFNYLQFGLMIPLVISLANNSYVTSFVLGYLFCFVVGILSLYVLTIRITQK